MSQPHPRASRHRKDRFEFDYPIGLIVVGICTAMAVFLRSRVAITNMAMFYLLGVIVVSVTCRQGAAILSALLGVTSFYYFCVPPWNSFVIEDYSYILILITTLTVALVITTLTIKIRSQAEHALDREERTRATYQLSRDLSEESSALDAARTAARTIAGVFDAKVDLFLANEQGALSQHIGETGDSTGSENQRTEAQSILETREESMSLVRSGHNIAVQMGVPLVCSGSIVAVLILTTEDRDRFSDPEERHFLEVLCGQIAAAVERLRNSAAVREAEVEIQTERTRNALLNAVSHDIKTPLASIYGAVTGLLEEEQRLSPGVRRELLESISDESQRLNRVVNNLLEMTSLDAGL